MKKNNHLVIYQFYEKDNVYLENLIHFLIFGYSKNKDYLILVSGTLSIEIPSLDNLEIVTVENKNNDYGAICALINNRKEKIFDYDNVFFINSSVRGPFVPAAFHMPWEKSFTNKLSNEVGIVGTTINILPNSGVHFRHYQSLYGGLGPFSHIQTMAFVLKGEMIKRLYHDGFFNNTEELSSVAIISKYEIRLSQLIIEYGFNIACLLPEYNSIDYRKPHEQININARYGDPSYVFGYFGRTPHPYETIFTKTNRDVCSIKYLDRLAYSQLHHTEIDAKIFEIREVQIYIQKLMTDISQKELVLMERIDTH